MRQGQKAECFVECLGNMAVVSDDSHDFLSYTKSWFYKVNRGGLFPLNDETFMFFIEIEKMVRVLLHRHITESDSRKDVEYVIKEILKSDDVQFHWALIALNIESDEEMQELLHEIVRMWVTIRGFSVAAVWMETTSIKANNIKIYWSQKTFILND